MSIPPDYLNQIVTGDARDLAERIPDESVDLIFTDPVYENIEDYAWLARTAARVLKPDSPCLAFCATGLLPETIAAMQHGGLTYRWNIIVYRPNEVKPRPGPTGRCCYATLLWFGKGQSKVIQRINDVCVEPVPTLHAGRLANHVWHKQTKSILTYMRSFSRAGTLVADFFAGGGTMPAIAKQTGRSFIAFEIDPATAERARERVAHTQAMHPVFLEEQQPMELAV